MKSENKSSLTLFTVWSQGRTWAVYASIDANGLSLNIALDSGDTLKLDSAFYGMSATITFVNGDALDLETLVGETLLTPVNIINGASGGRVYGGAGNDDEWKMAA